MSYQVAAELVDAAVSQSAQVRIELGVRWKLFALCSPVDWHDSVFVGAGKRIAVPVIFGAVAMDIDRFAQWPIDDHLVLRDTYDAPANILQCAFHLRFLLLGGLRRFLKAPVPPHFASSMPVQRNSRILP